MAQGNEPSPADDHDRELAQIPLREPLEEFLTAKSKGRTNDTGTYRRNLERDLTAFLTFLDEEVRQPPETFADLSDRHCRQYARHLDRRDLADGTVLTYYANVSAYLGWCVREGFLDENPAQTGRATEPLPDDDGRRSGDQQAWTPTQRTQITRHCDRRVEEALDSLSEDRWTALKALRDRALVYFVAYSGIRGAELLAAPQDDRRTGVQWADVSLADSRVTVLAKTQDPDDRALPAPIHGLLEQLYEVLDPASDDWPVIPSMHRASIYSRVRSTLQERGVDEATIDDRIADGTPFELLRNHEIRPPAMTTTGARQLMQRLTEAAGIDVDDEHGYLTLHGARRGAGEVMVRSKGYAAAARLLDDTERMVRERYSHIEAGELADEATDAFDQVDR